MVKPADLIDIQKEFLKRAEKTASQLIEGYKESLGFFPYPISMNRFTYALFVMLPYWLSLGDDGEPNNSLLQRHGAYIVYKTQVEDDLMASFRLAMLGHYSAANVLLRSSLEILCRGAFLDGISKHDLRQTCKLLSKKTRRKIDGEKRSIEGLFNELLTQDAHLLDDFEVRSGSVLDKLSVFMGLNQYRGMFPSFFAVVEQLEKWGHFQPIENPVNLVYHGGYHLLSLPVHGHIDSLDVGQRLLNEKSLFALPNRVSDHLKSYLNHFDQLLDLGLVLTINLISRHPETPGIMQTIQRILSFPLFADTSAEYFKQRIIELQEGFASSI